MKHVSALSEFENVAPQTRKFAEAMRKEFVSEVFRKGDKN
jgi:hypothetical protein